MSKSKLERLISGFIEFDQSRLKTANTVTTRLYQPARDPADFYLLWEGLKQDHFPRSV
jgi:hypothetical protein